MRQNPRSLQYKFSFDHGSRTNHQLILVNNGDSVQSLNTLSFTTNALIENPWQILGQSWSKVQRQQQGNLYYYSLQLDNPLQLQPGENLVLEYSVSQALGPVAVAMPQNSVAVNNNLITSVYQNNPQKNPHPKSSLIIYHANWGQYQYQRTENDEFFESENCQVYAFIGFNESGNIFTLDNWGDQFELPLLALQKQNKPYLQTSIGFGGWTNAGKRMNTVFSQMAANPQARANFVAQAVAAAVQLGVNGIDIDWEYPDPADAANYVALMQELRQELTNKIGAEARLSIAAPAAKEKIEIFTQSQWQTVAAAVDQVSVMTYDYFGFIGGISDYHSPWKLSPDSPNNQDPTAKFYCIEETLKTYQNLGVDSKKIALGFPNYARAVIVDKPGNTYGLYQTVVGIPKGDFGDPSGIFSWDTINAHLNGQSSALDNLGIKQWNFFDSTHPLCKDSGMCLLSGELPNGQWVVINFLDQISAKARAQKISENALGGAMIWANYTETKDHAAAITTAISDGLSPNQTKNLSVQENSYQLTANKIFRPQFSPFPDAPLATPAIYPGTNTQIAFQVQGNKIVDNFGRGVKLKGLDRPSLEWNNQGQFFNPNDIENIAKWGSNVVRLSLNQKFWFESDSKETSGSYKQIIDAIIYYATQNQMAVILDLHWLDNGQALMANRDSIKFWQEIASEYKDFGTVMFELYNEPFGITQNTWLHGDADYAGFQELHDAVRATGANNPVIINGLDYGYDLSFVNDNFGVKGSNIIYGSHPYNEKGADNYQGPGGSFANNFQGVIKNNPVIFTEFGVNQSSYFDNDGYKAVYERTLNYAQNNNINYSAWAAWVEPNPANRNTFPCLIENWQYQPVNGGVQVHNDMHSNPPTNLFKPPMNLQKVQPTAPAWEEEPPSYAEATFNQPLSETELHFFVKILLLKQEEGYAEIKVPVMRELLLNRFNPTQLEQIMHEKRAILGEHRNLFKRAIQFVAGDEFAHRLFGKPESLQLAENLVQERSNGLTSS